MSGFDHHFLQSETF